jgi:hypothetical protein
MGVGTEKDGSRAAILGERSSAGLSWIETLPRTLLIYHRTLTYPSQLSPSSTHLSSNHRVLWKLLSLYNVADLQSLPYAYGPEVNHSHVSHLSSELIHVTERGRNRDQSIHMLDVTQSGRNVAPT